eukprot:4988587-Karenia_brevis.AAC.1
MGPTKSLLYAPPQFCSLTLKYLNTGSSSLSCVLVLTAILVWTVQFIGGQSTGHGWQSSDRMRTQAYASQHKNLKN